MDFAEPGTSYNIDQRYGNFHWARRSRMFRLPAGAHSLTLAVGVVSCLPPPYAQSCSFQEQASSNSVKIAVQ